MIRVVQMARAVRLMAEMATMNLIRRFSSLALAVVDDVGYVLPGGEQAEDVVEQVGGFISGGFAEAACDGGASPVEAG